MPSWTTTLALFVAAAGGAALLTRLAIAYAQRRAMFDLPGQRRNHREPTPRGGGIAIVAVLLVAAIASMLAGRVQPGFGIAFCIGLVLVAGIGWLDDHRPLSARVRLLVHFAASAVLVSQLPVPGAGGAGIALALVQWLCLATAINFWNFMDGINGLVASQTVWVAACVAVAFAAIGASGAALLALALAAATLGFLPFNLPRARVFMGDVGSGGLGFGCGALLLLAERLSAIPVWSVILIVSALMFDAGLTLAARMLRGRRWYTAHREHLYQWLVRSGASHVRVTLLYLLWNLCLVLPLLWLSHEVPALAPLTAAVAGLLAVCAWILGRQQALRRVAARGAR